MYLSCSWSLDEREGWKGPLPGDYSFVDWPTNQGTSSVRTPGAEPQAALAEFRPLSGTTAQHFSRQTSPRIHTSSINPLWGKNRAPGTTVKMCPRDLIRNPPRRHTGGRSSKVAHWIATFKCAQSRILFRIKALFNMCLEGTLYWVTWINHKSALSSLIENSP